ncbi:hypothetical protein [Accumulibacter sp.]|uniref:hypothetical protein n=1 Tax=Accumulibacter sp. TaxID=2053492 RepID=UPI0028C3CDB5|nr:hypothetical protein [Accumulibacter sp.]
MSRAATTDVLPRVHLALIAAVLVGAGCTTTLDGHPATADSQGLRYHLPAPHIYMAPQSDGSVRAQVKYLPDPNNTYTLNLNSYLTSATFNVETKDGMLTTVSLDTDSTAMSVAGVQAATEIRKAQIAAEQSEEKARKAQEQAKQEAVNNADETARVQREKLALLIDKQKFYTAHPKLNDEKTRLDLELEISQERLKLEQMERRLGLVRATPNGAFNDPGATAIVGKAYGPVLFRVLPVGEGVKLVAVEAQAVLDATAGGPAAAPAVGGLVAHPDRFEIKRADTQHEIVVHFSHPVTVDANASRLVRPSESATAVVIAGNKLKISAASGNTEVMVGLPNTLPPGNYRLDLIVQRDSGERKMVSLRVSWLEN